MSDSVQKHTPGPWAICEHGWSNTSVIAGDDCICALDINHATEETQEPLEAVMAANARLIAAAPELLEALQWAEQFNRRPDEGYNDCFERIADVFYRQTGYLRPGKDASPQAGNSDDERQAAWAAWNSAGITKMRAAIAKATGAA